MSCLYHFAIQKSWTLLLYTHWDIRLSFNQSTMATFTKIEESETPSITIHPAHKIAKINGNVYGGFTE